jgi:IS1 family transposase
MWTYNSGFKPGHTVTKLLVDLGQACMVYHDQNVRNVTVRRLQCDEIWAYVGAKAKNVSAEKKEIGWGDVWTWVGIDAETKLVVSYLIGGRGADWANDFMQDCASRIKNRVQITTDGHKAYLEAVENAFGADVDYAQLHKIYGASLENETRYSPAVCIGCEMKQVIGNPDPKLDHLVGEFKTPADNVSYNAYSRKATSHVRWGRRPQLT